MSFWNWLIGQKSTPLEVKKYLIVGLGNIGAPYHNTRHNIGFDALDALCEEKELSFEDLRYGAISTTKFKGRTLLLLKPSTFMNKSGKAVRYWALKENIPLENILIITDDLNLPFGTLRLKTKGSDGGHNGLKDIQAQLNTTNYARLRFGINTEEKGYNTIDFVLGKWSVQEQTSLKERYATIIKMIFSFATQGAQNTMNQFNGK